MVPHFIPKELFREFTRHFQAPHLGCEDAGVNVSKQSRGVVLRQAWKRFLFAAWRCSHQQQKIPKHQTSDPQPTAERQETTEQDCCDVNNIDAEVQAGCSPVDRSVRVRPLSHSHTVSKLKLKMRICWRMIVCRCYRITG